MAHKKPEPRQTIHRNKFFVSFKVFATRKRAKGRDFYQVLIFRDKKTMHQYYAAQQAQFMATDEEVKRPQFEAICCSWDAFDVQPGKRHKRVPDSGRVMFHRDYFGSGIVTHEMTHAACYLAKRNGYAPKVMSSSKWEERHCQQIHWLVEQFWRKYYRYEKRIKAL